MDKFAELLTDAQKRLILDADTSALVFGAAGEFVLIMGDELAADAIARGYRFCGVMGVTAEGQASALCQQDIDYIYTMMHASLEFAARYATLTKAREADFLRFAEGLYGLEDSRASQSNS